MEQILVEEREFDGITDLLDLTPETTDVVVVNVRNFLENQIFDLGLRDALEGVPGLGVDEQRVTRTQFPGRRIGVVRDDVGFGVGEDGRQRCCEPDDALFVGMADHQCAQAVVEYLTERADLTDLLVGAGLDDGECLVEANRLPRGARVSVSMFG